MATTYQERRAAAIWWEMRRRHALQIRDDYDDSEARLFREKSKQRVAKLQAEREQVIKGGTAFSAAPSGWERILRAMANSFGRSLKYIG